MKLNGKLLSLIFALMMLVPLGALVYYNRLPAPVPQLSLILDDQVLSLEAPFYLEDGRVFLKTQMLDSLGIQYTVESEEERLVIPVTAGKSTYEDGLLTRQITSQGGNVNFPLKALNDGWYIELERLDQWLDLRSNLTPDERCLMLDSPGDRAHGIVAPEGTVLYSEPEGKGKRYRELVEGERLRLFSETKNEYRLRTEDGLVGYGRKDAIIAYPEKVDGQQAFINVRDDARQYGAINITFEYVDRYSATPNLSDETKIQGLDVLCPTWFSLNEDSVVTNDASIRYVRSAHDLGYRVWGVFRNGFEPNRTHALLASEELQSRAVADIACYVAFYELDGINIDFENVYKKDQKALSSFLRQLDAALTRQGVTLSIDAAPPWGSDQWSLFLDRGAAARTADYVILMAYDEHYANSPESGSVASLQWAERAVTESLEQIPAEKLVLGVPLYTRVWTETPDGTGGIAVTSKAIGMKDQEELLLGKNPEYLFDEQAGQLTASYEESGTLRRIWLENEESMKTRLQLIQKHKLAGVASWRRGFEVEAFWAWAHEALKGR